ncbi:hypothetical protein V8E53_009009, partial [Lactarius tabidus]
RLAVLTPSFLPGAQPKRTPTLLTPTVLSRAIAHNHWFTPSFPFILRLPNTFFISPPH